MNYKQPEIDLMFWQYCMGVLDAINSRNDGFATLTDLNNLASERHDKISSIYHVSPSFKVEFEFHATHFSIKKV